MSLADQLITRGWTKRAFVDGNGRVCLVGGLLGELDQLEPSRVRMNAAAKETYDAAQMILRDVCSQERETYDFIYINDIPETTFDDVLRLAKRFDEVVDWMKEMKGQDEASTRP